MGMGIFSIYKIAYRFFVVLCIFCIAISSRSVLEGFNEEALGHQRTALFICPNHFNGLFLANERLGYVVSDQPIWGRLGNQLFTVSAVLAYAWDHGFEPIFTCFSRDDNQLSYNGSRVFFRLNKGAFSYPIHRRFVESSIYLHDPEPMPNFHTLQNVSLQGQFVCYKYFHHHRDELLAMFAPSPDIMDILYSKYQDLLDSTKTVGVHVRTFSRSYHQLSISLCGFVGLEYYKRAFDLYPDDSIFVVFSDRINWCRVNFPKRFPNLKFVFVEGNDHVVDLYLMSLMKHQIISNSTFSWWAAYLNQNPHSTIACPDQAFLGLPSWKTITADYLARYPDDMEMYDEITVDDAQDYHSGNNATKR